MNKTLSLAPVSHNEMPSTVGLLFVVIAISVLTIIELSYCVLCWMEERPN